MQEDRSPPSVPSSRSTSSPGSGYIQFDDKTVCGEFWDMAASEVVCRELGWGPALDIGGYTKEFLGSPATKFHDSTPLCTGAEEKLDKCEMKKLTSDCKWGASVRCQRTIHQDQRNQDPKIRSGEESGESEKAIIGVMILDKFPVCFF